MIGDRVRTELRNFAELLGVTAIAVAQPVFDLLANNVFLITLRRADRIDLIAVAIAVTVIPAVVVASIEVAVGLVSTFARRVVHLVALAIGVALFVMGAARLALGLGAAPAAVLAGAVAAAFAFAAARFATVRLWLQYASFAAPVFALLFVLVSPAATAIDPAADVEAVTIGDPRRVVMIVFDELPLTSLVKGDGSGELDAARLPSFARLAQDATWYRNSTTVAPLTDVAVPSLFTGQFPAGEIEAATASNHPDSLFSLLGGTYSMHVHESVTQVCPVARCRRGFVQSMSRPGRVRTLVAEGFDLLGDRLWGDEIDAVDLAGVFALDPDPLTTGTRWVQEIRGRTNRPQLDVLHVFLPHLPWQYLPDGRAATAPTIEPGANGTRWVSDWAAAAGRARHLQQLEASDRLLGMTLDRLVQLGEYDDALVIVTADHGAAFSAGEPIRGLSGVNAAQILWTPLFIKYPGQTEGTVDDRLVRSLDLLPTVADVVDVEVPFRLDGRSLVAGPPSDGSSADPKEIVVADWELSPLRPTAGGDSVTIGDIDAKFAQALLGLGPLATDPLARYRIGRHGALVGTTVAERLGEPSDGVATIKGGATIGRVDLDAIALPWLDASGATSGLAPGVPLAITVNDVISGLAEVDAAGPATGWFARLAPDWFEAGDGNQIRVYRVVGEGDSVELAPLSTG